MDGKQLKSNMDTCANQIVKTKELIQEFKEKTEFAKRDRQELYRDLATFEFNFSKCEQRRMFAQIDHMMQSIKEQQTEYDKLSKNDHIRGWVMPDQLTDLKFVFDKVNTMND